MARKPRVITQCVANTYTGDDQRIIEFSDYAVSDDCGGLINLRRHDGRLLVEVYRCDGPIDVRVNPAQINLGAGDAAGLVVAAVRAALHALHGIEVDLSAEGRAELTWAATRLVRRISELGGFSVSQELAALAELSNTPQTTNP